MINLSVRQLQPPSGDGDKPDRPNRSGSRTAPRGDELPYQVEVWDETGTAAEFVIAVTVNSSVGYAAYYAAARAYPGRVITLSCDGQILSRWTGQVH